MTGFVVFCLFFCAIYVPGRCDTMLGPGEWNLINIRMCPYERNSQFDCDINIRKVNRTQYGFNVHMKLGTNLDKSKSVRMDICKRMDGGCKPYLMLADIDFEHFVDSFAKENAKRFLMSAKVDPPQFPLEAGEYTVKDFIFDFNELPVNSLYGEFIATSYILKNYVQVIGCIEVVVEHRNTYDDNEEYE